MLIRVMDKQRCRLVFGKDLLLGRENIRLTWNSWRLFLVADPRLDKK